MLNHAVFSERKRMKIAITATAPTLDADVDPRFGRCAYFLIVDTDTMEFEAVENANAALGGGAGIQSGQLMASRNVKFVLTGNCGPNAHATLSAAGIGVVPGCSGTVRDAVERFKAGQFNTASEPTVASHSGMADMPSPSQNQPMPAQQPPMPGGGMGMGRGAGGGGGRGMGRGMGKGMGRGGGQGRGQGGGGMGQGRGQGRSMGG
jgi:predicted Fe-Mo cluster-binding NifX family protein